jgi:hypothetical protein
MPMHLRHGGSHTRDDFRVSLSGNGEGGGVSRGRRVNQWKERLAEAPAWFGFVATFGLGGYFLVAHFLGDSPVPLRSGEEFHLLLLGAAAPAVLALAVYQHFRR